MVTTVAGVDDPLEQPMDKSGSGYWGIDATQGMQSDLIGLVHDAEIVGSIQLPNLRILTPGTECPVASVVLKLMAAARRAESARGGSCCSPASTCAR